MAKGDQGPDLRMGNVETAGCVSRRSSRLQLTPRGAWRKWPLWDLGITNAFLQPDGFDRVVYLRALCVWNSKDTRRVSDLRAPAYGLSDAPAAFRRPLRKYLVNSADSLPSVGIRFKVSSFDPRMYFIFGNRRSQVGDHHTS